MPNDYVNKIQDGETQYDIQDARVPAPQEGDAGKVLKVSEALGFELGNAGGGSGFQLYKHTLDLTLSYTYNEHQFTNNNRQLIVLSNQSTQFSNNELYYIGAAMQNNGLFIEKGGEHRIFLVCGSFSSPGDSGQFSNQCINALEFIAEGFGYIVFNYPGASNGRLEYFDSDTIDLETGKRKARTNLLSNSSIVLNSDTVENF